MSDIYRNKEFCVHKLNNFGFEKEEHIRNSFDKLLNDLSKIIGECKGEREFSIVKIKLEEACFFAKKSMAIHGINQIIEGDK